MRPFEKPVDSTVYRDYLQYVQTPMDLETIERKIKAGSYETPEDFEYDVHLIFRNCEAYNTPRKTDQMVAMGKNGAKEFRKLFSKRMKAYENPEESKKHSISTPSNPNKAKRLKIENSTELSKQPKSATTRISIVQKTLKKRKYVKFGEVIDDLRLIFSNALKYNAKHKGTGNISGLAYDAAVYMSGKLEMAIDKCFCLFLIV
mmetsp:Transcript_27704/g.42163  ORF Transcript_27704/g.42163 Transcript_27704/m.42163 type:complete len:203 (+) Transcript_27704:1528-2136(+)